MFGEQHENQWRGQAPSKSKFFFVLVGGAPYNCALKSYRATCDARLMVARVTARRKTRSGTLDGLPQITNISQQHYHNAFAILQRKTICTFTTIHILHNSMQHYRNHSIHHFSNIHKTRQFSKTKQHSPQCSYCYNHLPASSTVHINMLSIIITQQKRPARA